MIWKSLLLKFFFLGCAVAFVVTLNLQDDQVFEPAVLPSEVHIEPLSSIVTTIGLSPSEHRPRSVSHPNQSIPSFSAPISIELRAADGIDVNSAGFDALTQLPGIGVTLAQRIIDFRETHGPFGDLTTLMRIQGIGPKRFAKIQPLLSLTAP